MQNAKCKMQRYGLFPLPRKRSQARAEKHFAVLFKRQLPLLPPRQFCEIYEWKCRRGSKMRAGQDAKRVMLLLASVASLSLSLSFHAGRVQRKRTRGEPTLGQHEGQERSPIG